MMKKLARFVFALIILNILNPVGAQPAEKPSSDNSTSQTEKRQPDHLLISPKQIDPNKTYPLFIFIHGLGDCPRCMLDSFYDVITQQEFYTLIPEGPLTYGNGFSWYRLKNLTIFKHDAEHAEAIIKDLVDQVIVRYKIDQSKIFLSGFSQGGRLSFFIGIRNPHMFSTIIPIGGVYMDSLLDAYLKDAKSLNVEIFHGTEDDVNSFSMMQKAYKKLRASGLNVSLTTYPLGHTYNEAILEEVLKRVK